MSNELANVILTAIALIASISFFVHDKSKSGKQATLEFFSKFMSQEAFLLRSHGFSFFQLDEAEYRSVILVYLGESTSRNLKKDRSVLFLNLSPAEALAVVLNQFRVVKLMAEAKLFTEDGVLLFRYHLQYWEPLIRRLLDDMYSAYASNPASYIYHPWFDDIPWLYQRCQVEFKSYPNIPAAHLAVI